MSVKPWRSWGKTYNQGWNLALKGSNYNDSKSNPRSKINLGSASWVKGATSNQDWRDECCWKYNKNRCKKQSQDCKYEPRCTYCTIWGHGAFACRQKSGNKSISDASRSGTSTAPSRSSSVTSDTKSRKSEGKSK